MVNRNKIFTDLSKFAVDAMSTLSGLREEVETIVSLRVNKVIKKNDARYEHEWFAKDGQHPDRHGHKLLYDKIVSDIIKDE